MWYDGEHMLRLHIIGGRMGFVRHYCGQCDGLGMKWSRTEAGNPYHKTDIGAEEMDAMAPRRSRERHTRCPHPAGRHALSGRFWGSSAGGRMKVKKKRGGRRRRKRRRKRRRAKRRRERHPTRLPHPHLPPRLPHLRLHPHHPSRMMPAWG